MMLYNTILASYLYAIPPPDFVLGWVGTYLWYFLV